MSLRYDWETDIVPQLGTLVAATDGFSAATRGVVTLADGQAVFVKIGRHAKDTAWINKERAVYAWLAHVGYQFAPQLLAESEGALAIEDLSALDWSPQWSEAKLTAALQAMEALATLTPQAQANRLFERDEPEPNYWRLLLADQAKLQSLSERFPDTINPAVVAGYADQLDAYQPATSTLIHNDVRSDNLAYDPVRHIVKMIDWNWTTLGNQADDMVAFLVSVQRSGFDVLAQHADKMDYQAALFCAGFWFHEGSKSPPADVAKAESLREHQLDSALVALQFSHACYDVSINEEGKPT